MTTIEEVWVRAYCAAVTALVMKATDIDIAQLSFYATHIADQAAQDYRAEFS